MISVKFYAALAAAIAFAAVSLVLAVSTFAIGTEPPTLTEAIEKELKEIPSLETEEWLTTPTKGEYKGNTAPIEQALTLTVKDLKEYGLTWKDIRFFVRKCISYSPDGTDQPQGAHFLIHCTNRTVTRTEALIHNREAQSQARAQGSPAIPA